VSAAALTRGAHAADGEQSAPLGDPAFRPVIPARDEGRSPWGYDTANEPTTRPQSLRPEGGYGLPDKPQPYTRITSYHAHIYFDEDFDVRSVLGTLYLNTGQNLIEKFFNLQYNKHYLETRMYKIYRRNILLLHIKVRDTGMLIT